MAAGHGDAAWHGAAESPDAPWRHGRRARFCGRPQPAPDRPRTLMAGPGAEWFRRSHPSQLLAARMGSQRGRPHPAARAWQTPRRPRRRPGREWLGARGLPRRLTGQVSAADVPLRGHEGNGEPLTNSMAGTLSVPLHLSGIRWGSLGKVIVRIVLGCSAGLSAVRAAMVISGMPDRLFRRLPRQPQCNAQQHQADDGDCQGRGHRAW